MSRWRDLLGRLRLPYGAVSAIAAIVFLGASALKTHELATEPLNPSDVLGSRYWWIALVEVQVALGLAMLLGLVPRFTQWAAILLLGTFVLYLVYALATGQESCHCFGKASIWPGWVLAGDLAAIVFLVCARHGRPAPRFRLVSAAFATLTTLVGVVAAGAIASYSPTVLADDGTIVGNGPVVIETDRWVGTRFPLLSFIDSPVDLSRDNWIVVLFRADCPRCKPVLAGAKRLSIVALKNRAVPRVALIELPPYDHQFSDEAFLPCAFGRLTSSRTWFCQTPAVLVLRDGVIMAFVDDVASLEDAFAASDEE